MEDPRRMGRIEGGKDAIVYHVPCAQDWAVRHFGMVQLGDARLNRRVIEVATAMADDPAGSIPQQNKNWASTKGAYRLFDHEHATFEAMSQPHWDQTRLLAGELAVTLFVQDTTWLSYTGHPATQGLGRHGREQRSDGLGLFEHNVLAVEPQAEGSGRVLGLGWGKLWARDLPVIGKGRKRAASRCDPELESTRWVEAVKAVGAPPAGKRWIHVGDRESDLFDLYEQTQQMPGVGFLIRVTKQRNASAGHHHSVLSSPQRPKTSLEEICRSMPKLGNSRLWVRPRADRPGRWAKLAVSGGPVTIYSPWFGRRGSRTARPLCCWAVRVWEIDPPKGAEPIEWMLLSSEPVNDLADGLRLAEWYSLRWLIEEYHQCLKSGCKVEQRQLESTDRLAPLISMLSVLATRLLQIKNDARLTPDRPAAECVPGELLQTLSKLLKVPVKTMTVRRFTHEVAKRGGFLGRKSDGDPGWLTLWRGWRELSLITVGYELGKRCG